MEEIKKDVNMSNIDKLKSSIDKRGGFANPHRFKAIINYPTAVRNWQNLIPSSADKDFLNLTCESINLPGRQIETNDYSMYRNTIKMPSGYMNDEVNITFRLTEDYYAKEVFDKWQLSIFDQKNYLVGFFNDYVADMEFESLNKMNNTTHVVKLFDCYPVTVGGIEKTNESTDDILKLQVTIAYRDFETQYIKNSELVKLANDRSARAKLKKQKALASANQPNLNDPSLFNNPANNQFRGFA